MNGPPDDAARDALSRCRARLVPRLRDAIRRSEAGVLAAGTQLAQLVDHAVAQNRELGEALPEAQGRGGESGIDGAFRSQQRVVDTFARGILGELREQTGASQKAASLTGVILDLAASIEDIAQSSHILTINAKLEATRLGENGRPIAVIAGELAHVSRAVAQANATIAETAAQLVELLPALARSAASVQTRTEAFSTAFEIEQRETRSRLEHLQETMRAVLESSEQRAGRVLSLSHQALSSLQFQDPLAQDLSKAETVFVDVAAELGVALDEAAGPAAYRSLPEPAGAASGPTAGEILMF